MHGLATLARSQEHHDSLDLGVQALLDLQRDDGSWEGECVWNPMLAAQYTIAAHVMSLPLSSARRSGLLTHFRVTRHESGCWGLHPYDEGNLFVTTLVYVAARMLGAPADAQWLHDARTMFERDGVERIPTWGKAWLAMIGLYDWRGVNPILPEVWLLPPRIPLHPANFYCHTRAIYLGLAVAYAERFVAPANKLTKALRDELYGDRYATIDFSKCANEVRAADAPFRAGRPLRAVFSMMRLYDRMHSRALRRRSLGRLRGEMRDHLRASTHLALSPVNGLLSILALWAENPDDPDLQCAVERFDSWFWEDEDEGARVAGAGSVCWDTGFAIQALAEVPGADHLDAVTRGASFLASQQIERANFDYAAAHRIDPSGGWCFSESGHGWPVSDCTAEALLALLDTRPEALGRENAARAARFIFRCQNRDGGFGSYEPSKTRVPLEWMNPSEMFGRCMTERSYTECTASCLMALCRLRSQYPDLLRAQLDACIVRACGFLKKAQKANGSWNAAWGVQFIYATMFGVRGLIAAGMPPTDAHIRDACTWLRAHQRADGGWGEHHASGVEGRYVDAETASAVQTAWALITLVEGDDPDARSISRGVEALETMQLPSGQWPDGEFVGVFFETALLNYRLYRQYFPVMALSLHRRRNERRGATGSTL